MQAKTKKIAKLTAFCQEIDNNNYYQQKFAKMAVSPNMPTRKEAIVVSISCI